MKPPLDAPCVITTVAMVPVSSSRTEAPTVRKKSASTLSKAGRFAVANQ